MYIGKSLNGVLHRKHAKVRSMMHMETRCVLTHIIVPSDFSIMKYATALGPKLIPKAKRYNN